MPRLVSHPDEVKIVSRRFGMGATNIDRYIELGGYEAVKKCLAQGPDWIVEEMKASGLRGRGGAGFSAGMKWSFVPKQSAKPKYILVNGDESEPGTCKDHLIFLHDPHAVIEGTIIAGLAVGAKMGFIYLRGEYRYLLEIMERAVADAGDFARPGAARAGDADDRRSAVRLFIPFRGPGQELAVGVAAGDVGDHYGGQRPGMMQALTPPFDVAFVGKLAQHALERRPVGIFGAECPRNLARADFAGMLADEGKQLFARGKGGSFHRPLIGRFPGQRS